jgi:hypothetical protein
MASHNNFGTVGIGRAVAPRAPSLPDQGGARGATRPTCTVEIECGNVIVIRHSNLERGRFHIVFRFVHVVVSKTSSGE